MATAECEEFNTKLKDKYSEILLQNRQKQSMERKINGDCAFFHEWVLTWPVFKIWTYDRLQRGSSSEQSLCSVCTSGSTFVILSCPVTCDGVPLPCSAADSIVCM